MHASSTTSRRVRRLAAVGDANPGMPPGVGATPDVVDLPRHTEVTLRATMLG